VPGRRRPTLEGGPRLSAVAPKAPEAPESCVGHEAQRIRGNMPGSQRTSEDCGGDIKFQWRGKT
jgi:hypothetical protein